MKFMNSFQCLMGGNAVQLQQSSSSSSISPYTSIAQSSLDNHERRNEKEVKKNKKTKKRKDKKVIMVFKPDGDISVYHKPIMVAEVTTTDEYMVCKSDSFYIGQKIQSLSGSDRLQPGHTYFLLPAHLLHSVLSFVTIASFTSKKQDADGVNAKTEVKAAFLKKAATSSCSPFNIQKTPSGTLRIQVSEMFISQLMMDQAAASNPGRELVDGEPSDQLLCTTPQLQKEYKQLVAGSRRSWKPKLEMIKESPSKGRRKVKMLLSASINSMKKKMKNKKSNQQMPSSSSSTSSSSKKISKKKVKKKMKSKKSSRQSAAAVVFPPSSALIQAR